MAKKKDINPIVYKLTFVKDQNYSLIDHDGSVLITSPTLENLMSALIDNAKVDNHFMKPSFTPINNWTLPEKRCIGCAVESLDSNIGEFVEGKTIDWKSRNHSPYDYTFSKSGDQYTYQSRKLQHSPVLDTFDQLLVSYMIDASSLIKLERKKDQFPAPMNIKINEGFGIHQKEILYTINDGIFGRLYPVRNYKEPVKEHVRF